MSRVTNFEEVKLELKGHLQEYLEQMGVEVKHGAFSCIHPEHEDKNPSATIIDGERWHCFSCGARGDIFDACYFLENKPSSGPVFVSQTLVPLAERFGVSVENNPSESERRKLETYNAYQIACNYIGQHATERAVAEMQNRGWDLVQASTRGIGSVESNQAFVDHLIGYGFNREFLDEVDLTRSTLFNENNLIFTVYDVHGRPCGFASKNLLWEKGATYPDGKKVFKYINSKNTDTDVKCNIYDKSETLYNLHSAKKEAGTTYIFEGYTDVETAIQHGIKNAVCVGGTAFTEHQALALKTIGRTDITLVLDGDEAGLKKTDKIIKAFSSLGGYRLKVVRIPGGADPDEFIRENGAEAFHSLREFGAFEWQLEQFDDRFDPASICEAMVKIIASEPLSTTREEMARTLARKVPYSVNAILSDVDGLIRADEVERSDQRKNILDHLMVSLKRYPADWRISVQNAVSDLDNIEASYVDETFNKDTYISQISLVKEREEAYDESNQGYRLGDWIELEKALKGDWEATLNLVGGAANTGKTGFMANLAERLERNNEEKNMTVLFQTIDDTFHQFLTRLVCIKARKHYPGITLNKIKNPQGFSQDCSRILEARDQAYKEIISLAQNERLIIKSGEERGGNTLKFTRDWIRYHKQRDPDRKIILFLDNFHRLGDYAGNKDERIRFKLLSSELKKIAKDEGATIWATVEYTKAAGTTRPNNSDISESVAMEYDANFIMHVFNELHVRRDDAETYHEVPTVMGQTQEVMEKLPTIEGIVGKNKITEFKGSLFWDFFPAQAAFTQQPLNAIKSRRETNALKAGVERTVPRDQYMPDHGQSSTATPRM